MYAFCIEYLLSISLSLFHDLSYLTGTYCTATFTDREFQTFFHRDRSDQLYSQVDVITRHYHFNTFRQFDTHQLRL